MIRQHLSIASLEQKNDNITTLATTKEQVQLSIGSNTVQAQNAEPEATNIPSLEPAVVPTSSKNSTLTEVSDNEELYDKSGSKLIQD